MLVREALGELVRVIEPLLGQLHVAFEAVLLGFVFHVELLELIDFFDDFVELVSFLLKVLVCGF